MKIKSYIFLFLLALILIFILGVRYGQKVEQTNKVVNYVLSITPSPTITPIQPLEFKKYSNKGCGIEFTYPSSAVVNSEATYSALLVDLNGYIAIDCNSKNDMTTIINDDKVATASLTFKNRPIKAKTMDNGRNFIFSFYNPQNGKTIYTSVGKRFYPLFESSLQFTY